jgi:N-acetylmuramoyl-L-alanine amidase/putative methionine-R-sulfoxide reductase with GAF domain
MATSTTKPDIQLSVSVTGTGSRAWGTPDSGPMGAAKKASPQEALQALLAFSALHDQIRRRKALASRSSIFDSPIAQAEFEPAELFVLDEVLQLVAERAVAITGADGLAIALAENNEIVLRAAAGTVRPDVGQRIDRDSAFSGGCFRTAQIIHCDDTETDSRVNLHACRKMGARSMVAVPLCGRKRVIGVLEAFSSWPFAFNESDVRNLSLLAELILGALKPEDEDRFALSAQVAATKLEDPKAAPAVSEPPRLFPPTKPLEPIKANAPKIPGTIVEPAKPEIAKQEIPKPELTKQVATPTTAVPPVAVTAPSAPRIPVPPKPLAPPETPKAVAPAPAAVPAPPATSKISAPIAPLQKPTVPEVLKAATPAITTPAMTPAASPKPVAPEAPKATTPVIAPSAAPAITPISKSVLAPAPKPLETQAAAAPAVPVAPAGKPVEEVKEAKPTIDTAAAPDSAPEPALTFGQRPEASNRPWFLVMLVGTVIAAAFIAGVWWKMKTAQIGSAMVQNQPITQPVAQVKPVIPALDANPSTQTDGVSAGNEPEDTPATPQELSKFPRVTAVRHWSSGDSSTVVLDLEDQVQYEPGHVANPERFYFDLRDTQLAPGLEGKSFDGDSLLSHIRIAQPVSGMTRVVLEARPSANLSTPQVSLERDPYRLVIQVSKPGATPKGAVNLFPTAPEAEKAKLAIVVPPPTKDDLQLRAHVAKMRIVVDAGHGGWDLGTVGRRGLLEKDLVLEIAQRLGKLLESRLGADVIYTRQDDNYIPLDDRAVIANQAQADLFVSVHANYSDLPSARGVETYYTNFFSAPGSKDLPANATPKEAAMRSVPKNVAMPTLTATELHDRIEQSRRLATSVQHSLYGTLSLQNSGLRDRGIKEAGFVVLTESAMPGILAEVSFVSSPTDEQKLRSDGYREQIAEALYRGIAKYAAAKTVKVAAK